MEKFNWANKKVLVTGAGGFIGSHLCEQLSRMGANVRAMVHYNALGRWGWLDYADTRGKLDIFPGDITDRDSVSEAVNDRSIIFHLAALISIPYSYAAPESYVQTNILGTLNLLEAAKEARIRRFIHTSTSEAYGTAQYTPIDENHPLRGQSPYAASKIGADKIAESFYCSFGLPVVVVRPFNTFGPRQSARAIVPAIITQALSRKTIKLGATYPVRDLNFVKDTVLGMIAAAESPDSALGEVFNIGSGREISILELANLIIRMTGKKVRIKSISERFRPKNSEVERLLADTAKAAKILNWRPRYTLERGLEETVAWFKRPGNLELYKSDRYIV
ncbi:MAG: GDP-mannose 4,6-dehydratase [Candidatus Omnitrophota bacterium]